MRLVITKKYWVKAVKATSPTLRHQLMKEAFEAVDRPLIDGNVDRDDFGHLFDTPYDADLASVQLEDDGSVWLRVTFFNSVDLRLSELQLPQEVQDRIVAQIKQLLPPKRASGRGKKTAKTSV